MRVEQVLLAEGVTNDSRGALSLIGVNQRVIASPNLPVNIRLQCVVMLTDEVADEDRTFDESAPGNVSIEVLRPDGTTAFAVTQPIVRVQKRFVDLPVLINVISGIVVTGTTHGVFMLRARYIPPNGEPQQERHVPIYVVAPPPTLTPEAPMRAFDLSSVDSS